MTMKTLAINVALDFMATMKEEKFETFTEMKKCYWWTTKDIKEEVISIVNGCPSCCAIETGDVTIYTDLNTFVEISYRALINEVYKLLRNWNIY